MFKLRGMQLELLCFILKEDRLESEGADPRLERDPSKDESDLPGFPEKGFNEPDKTPTQSGRVGVLVNKRDLLLGRLNRILDEINRSYSSWTRELASLNARSGRLRFACPPTVEIPQSEEVTIVT